MEQHYIQSAFLGREVVVDTYCPLHITNLSTLSLLLINDGQDLPKMNFTTLYEGLLQSNQVQPLLCVGIHAGVDRKVEYGTAKIPDFAGRGSRAGSYHQFILEELVPYLHVQYCLESFRTVGVAGFSLGGLTALDLVWRYPKIFSVAGVFSGSLWWRSRDLDDEYNEDEDRIMHALIRKGRYHRGLRFYFTTGSLDETADRNNNGIIDSIDDTLGLIEELKRKGYSEADIEYVNYEDGRHDVETWGRAMPRFLLWGFGPASAARGKKKAIK
ncbi:MAG TPA: alpha/beta hydrolase-fold protein [Chitinophagaceae bacterium]